MDNNNKKIIFVATNVQHTGCLRPIKDEMDKRGYNTDFAHAKTREELIMICNGIYPEDGDCYIVSGGENIVGDNIREKCIYHVHGAGNENAYFYNEMKGVLTPGTRLQEMYNTSFPDKSDRFKLVGYPKTDILFSDKSNDVANKLRSILHLPYEKTILFAGFYLYADRYDDWYPVLCSTIHKLIRTAISEKFNLIIKPHISTMIMSDMRNSIPEFYEGHGKIYLYERDLLDPKIGSPYSDFRDHFSNIKYINWINPMIPSIEPLFLISDLCVCGDDSSTAFEFITTGKPIITVNEIPNKTKIGIFNSLANNSLSDLNERISELIKNKDLSSKYVKMLQSNYSDKYVYKPDGNATKRAADAIEELMGW